MSDLRSIIESDLAVTLEGDFAPVDSLGVGRITLIDNNGVEHTGIKGRVDYDYVSQTEDGTVIVVQEPVVILRKSSLPVPIIEPDRWVIKMPIGPNATDPIADFKLSGPNPVRNANTIGFVKLFPKKVVQS